VFFTTLSCTPLTANCGSGSCLKYSSLYGGVIWGCIHIQGMKQAGVDIERTPYLRPHEGLVKSFLVFFYCAMSGRRNPWNACAARGMFSLFRCGSQGWPKPKISKGGFCMGSRGRRVVSPSNSESMENLRRLSQNYTGVDPKIR
jgi:hypothetical protein